MADSKPQSFANHTRFDPPFHFFLLPIFALGIILSIVHFCAHFSHSDARENFHAFLIVLLAFALAGMLLKTRLYAVKVQDRVIRLEERLRLTQLAPEPLRSRIPQLTESQLVGLRFASDGEVVQLAERALNEKLSQKQIKQAVKNWRPDYWRV